MLKQQTSVPSTSAAHRLRSCAAAGATGARASGSFGFNVLRLQTRWPPRHTTSPPPQPQAHTATFTAPTTCSQTKTQSHTLLPPQPRSLRVSQSDPRHTPSKPRPQAYISRRFSAAGNRGTPVRLTDFDRTVHIPLGNCALLWTADMRSNRWPTTSLSRLHQVLRTLRVDHKHPDGSESTWRLVEASDGPGVRFPQYVLAVKWTSVVLRARRSIPLVETSPQHLRVWTSRSRTHPRPFYPSPRGDTHPRNPQSPLLHSTRSPSSPPPSPFHHPR